MRRKKLGILAALLCALLPVAAYAVHMEMVDQAGTWHDVTTNQDLTLLTSAARTAATASAAQLNHNGRGVIVFLNVTAASGTGGLTVQIQGQDPASGVWVSFLSASAAVTATGVKSYIVYPGNSTADGTQAAAGVLSRTWRVNITVGDNSSYTYSVGASLIN